MTTKYNLQTYILYEDEDVFVVNKPPNVSSSTDNNPKRNISLIELARKYLPESQLCHRLDKKTSGAIIIAKTKQAYKFISVLLQELKVNKIYHAIIYNNKKFENYHIDLLLIQK